jgi:hypothetical protein
MKRARLFLLLLSALLVISVVITISGGDGKEIVQQEFTACVVSICVADTVIGKKCEILPAKVSKIHLTVDNSKTRITVSPTEIKCE